MKYFIVTWKITTLVVKNGFYISVRLFKLPQFLFLKYIATINKDTWTTLI